MRRATTAGTPSLAQHCGAPTTPHPRGNGGCRTTMPIAFGTDPNVGIEAGAATTPRIGRVAQTVARLLGRRPATVHQYIHSTTTLRPTDIVAVLARQSLAVGEPETFLKVMAPIRAAAKLADVSPFTADAWLNELDALQVRVACLRSAIQRRIEERTR